MNNQILKLPSRVYEEPMDILRQTVGYFDKRKNVDEYIQMAEGYDGRELIAVLKMHLPAGSTILELGMGPGKDLGLLAESYTVTSSDSSNVSIDLYCDNQPVAGLLKLDAADIETERTFDCIYSNKVLHHLAKSDLHRSFIRQKELFTDGGLLMHSFQHGDKEEEHHGLHFVYYIENALLNAIGAAFEVVTTDNNSARLTALSDAVVCRRIPCIRVTKTSIIN